ncbi:MAG: hypothetical protein CMI53_03155 [Parcubacteria group bacterium]|nr:hypothetical protein [Parcubacteria group bacterium]|tara:strand:- start:7221 stop:7481 length:261 start_codon:yes stop_codon:yes gene_type:complete
MSKEQGPSPEEMGIKNENSDDAKLKEFWDQYSTEELKRAIEPGDPMDDMWGMTPDAGELGEDFNPTKSSKDVVNKILEERGENVDN